MADNLQDDETQIILSSQQGDIAAFNLLVLRYQQSVYNVALRMIGDSDAAADVTQETFLAALRAIKSFRAGSSFRAWLLRIASNQSCDHWRRTHRHAQESLDSLTDEDELHTSGVLSSLIATGDQVNPEESLLSRELQELISRGLQTLSLDQRVAVILCDIQGLSYEEIAATTSTTLGTVRSRIARGRLRLRDYLYQHQELLPRSYRLIVSHNTEQLHKEPEEPSK
ncbi:MAG TPA: sigma-70 family RNA polymerase sigma factor [Ktedonobacteraceae bacterium]